MKRTSKGLLVLTAVLVAFVVGNGLRRPAKAEITTDVATRVYTIEFDDWVVVYTNALLRALTPDYNVSIIKEPTNRGVRFHVVGSYTNNAAGLNWYRTQGSKIRDRLGPLCRSWTSEGFAISVNDFDVNIRKSE